MNMAMRAVAVQQSISVAKNSSIKLATWSVAATLLTMMLLLSALGIIYAKDLNRRLFIQYQTLTLQKTQLLTRWGKLLLEQSAWSTQARIQRLAQQQLDMVTPRTNDIVLVESHRASATR